jgi:hypothetical protein
MNEQATAGPWPSGAGGEASGAGNPRDPRTHGTGNPKGTPGPAPLANRKAPEMVYKYFHQYPNHKYSDIGNIKYNSKF